MCLALYFSEEVSFFSFLLKLLVLSTSFSSPGSTFHHVGPNTLNDLAAKVFFLLCGIFRCLYFMLAVRCLHPPSCSCSRSCRYIGALPIRHLYTNVNVLCLILSLTDNQCSCVKHSVTLLLLSLFRMILFAIF